MAGEPEVDNDSDASRETVFLGNQFRVDGGRLIITGFFTGPHKMVLILSIGLLITSLVLLSQSMMSFEASIWMIPVTIISAFLSAIFFRASYIHTMPFEIMLDRDSFEIMVTRPDRPELVINAHDISFVIQPRDWFANLDPFWLTVQLPDNRRFFLADTSSRKTAEVLRGHLDQWLSAGP